MSCCNNNCNHDPCGSSFNQAVTQAAQYAQYAKTQANEAAASVVEAQDILDDFNKKYLGAFAVAPLGPQETGALYWNTASNNLWVWNGTIWVVADFNEFTNFLASGTTEARNLVTRTADWVNIKDFGAKGDYTTDDTTAIQSAINSLPAQGGTVYLPKGRYRTTGTITINKDGVSLIGDGDGGPSNTISPNETLNNVAVVAPKGSTQIIGDFIVGPVLRIKTENVTVSGLSIDSSSDRPGANAPISTGIPGRKGGGGSNGHGIWIQSDDTSGAGTSRFMLEKVSVYNQPVDGILCVNKTVCSRIDFVSVNCCNRHAINIQGGQFSGMTNIVRAGQIQINNVNTSRCGGHGLAVGGLDENISGDPPYRIEINNLETSFNLITPANAIEPLVPCNVYLSGENFVMIDSAIDGRTRFAGPTVAAYTPLYIKGRNHDIINFRAIDPNPYGTYVGESVALGTRGITFQNYYLSNASGAPTPNTYDPAIFIQNVNCKGIRALSAVSMGQVPTNLINKIPGSAYEESYKDTTKTDRNAVFQNDGNSSGITTDFIYADAYRSSLPSEITINDDAAIYIEFDGPTRGIAYVSGNTIDRKCGVFHFRCGDASGDSEVIASSATNVAVVSPGVPLTGSTGSNGNLNFSVSTTLNRIYIENRTGANGGYAIILTNLNGGRTINGYAPSI